MQIVILSMLSRSLYRRSKLRGFFFFKQKTAYEIGQLRLAFVEFDDAVAVDLHVPDRSPRIDGEARLAMLAHEAIVVEAAQDVAVGEQEALAEERARLADRAGRADRLGLAAVRDAHAETRAVAEVPFDRFRSIPSQQHKLAQPAARERLDDALEVRPPAALDHRLRQPRCERAEARAEAAG